MKLMINSEKAKEKLGAFLTTSILTVLCSTVSAWGYFSAENKRTENYDYILKSAESYQDYCNAILTDPERTDAYLQMNDAMIQDFVLSKEEAQQMLTLQMGWKRKTDRDFQKKDVLKELKEKNPEGYEKVCYEIGNSFLFYYDVNVNRDRYSSAKTGLKNA